MCYIEIKRIMVHGPTEISWGIETSPTPLRLPPKTALRYILAGDNLIIAIESTPLGRITERVLALS